MRSFVLFVTTLLLTAPLTSLATDTENIAGAAGSDSPASTASNAHTITTPATVRGWVSLRAAVLKKGGGVRVLVDGVHTTYVKASGEFTLSLSPGVHIVDFSVRKYNMPQLRIDVSKKVAGKYKAMLNDRLRTALTGDQITINPISEVAYFETRESFNWMGMVKNPMVLIMVFGLGMAFLMPQDNQMKEMRKKLLAGDFEGAMSDDTPQVAAPQPPKTKKRIARQG